MTNEINEIVVELTINRPLPEVWEKMLNHFSDWWPRDFMGLAGSEKIQFEPHVGGRLFEVSPDGGELLWGTVISIKTNESLDLVGHVTASFGGPNINFVKMGLTPGEGDTTQFRLTNHVMGNLSDQGRERVTMGWNYLYSGLKAYCEA